MELDYIYTNLRLKARRCRSQFLTVKDDFEEIGINRRRGALNFDYVLAAKKIYGEK